ncbi:MAG TPA: lanthionine synthetase LanC family protein, partial [Chloroflexota bacterium]|nr:lanthionine synthetase LanC family protein [Chloroflexota bacterium]
MPPADASALAQDAAHSIFRQLDRTAEPQPDGIRWQTLDWHNHPHYIPEIFTGAGGIVFFLADYHRLTGSARALELAAGAVQWCASPDRESHRDPEWEWASNGIMRGRSGLGLAWLSLAAASESKDHLARAALVGETLLTTPIGPVTDWQDGSAGELLFLLRLSEATGDERFLRRATEHAAWLESIAVREGSDGCVWPWQTDHDEYAKWFGLSFVPGSTGIAYSLLCLYERTRHDRWASLGRAAAQTLQRQARPDKGGLNWPDTLDGFDRGEDRRCQWCYGASGVGLFLSKAAAVLQDATIRDLALGAGEATYAYGDVRRNPCLCHGLAGSADLLLDLHQLTGEPIWHDRAVELARQIVTRYRRPSPDGDLWQSDDPGCHSPDYLYGVSGTGHFFL